MERPSDLGRLPTAAWQRLQELTDRFEHAWEGAVSVDLAPFLPDETDQLFATALHELIKTDLEIRWRRGLPVVLDYYLERFPQLGGARAVSPQLIHEEYRVRRQYGDQPPADAYRRRFPEQFPAFERLLRERPPAGHFSTVHTPKEGGPANTPAPPAPPAASPPGTRPPEMLPVGGGYKLLERIGQGGFGEVWKAEAPGGIEVAVKVIHQPLDQEMAQREQQSLELIKRLRHPFLVQTQAYWPLQDRLYIVMELADCSLRDRLLECRKAGLTGIPADELLSFLGEVAEALDYLHDQQLLHRDIKPENILLVRGHAKLADFGLARVLEGRGLMAVSFAGTPPYMAPEIFKGQVNASSEQYSLAATYAELRLDHRIFPGGSIVEMMFQHLRAEPDLTGLPAAERQALLKALAKDHEARFDNCRALVQALREARDPSVPGRNVPERRPTRRLILAAGAAAAGLAAVWRAFQSGPQPLPSPRADWVPDGCTTADAPLVVDGYGRKFHDRVTLHQGGLSVPFVLVPCHGPPGPSASFYIMENKASNDLFMTAWQAPSFQEILAREARAQPEAVKHLWFLGGRAGGRNLGVDNPRHPVLRVSVVEAYCFATWLGGYLPNVQQWDKAAGRWDGDRPGPYDPAWQEERRRIAVGRAGEGPEEVGQSERDVSRLGVRDLAGNGLEWTRDLHLERGEVPCHDRDNTLTLVQLRGRSYAESEPLRFEDLERSEKGLPARPGVKHLLERYLDANPYLGFRVVLEQR